MSPVGSDPLPLKKWSILISIMCFGGLYILYMFSGAPSDNRMGLLRIESTFIPPTVSIPSSKHALSKKISIENILIPPTVSAPSSKHSVIRKKSRDESVELCKWNSSELFNTSELKQLYKYWMNQENPGKANEPRLEDLRNIDQLLKAKERVANLTRRTNNTSRTEYKSMDITIKASLKISKSCFILDVKLSELIHGKLSDGGASYELIIENEAFGLHAMCPVTDMFNGTYSFRCPCINKDIPVNSVGTLRIFFANFDAFRRIWNPWNRTIWSENLGNLKQYRDIDEYVGHCEGYWRLLHNTSTWIQSGSAINHLERKQIDICLSSYDLISFIGDSHLRYEFYYYLYLRNQLNPNLPEKLNFHKRIGNMDFNWMGFFGRIFTTIGKYEKQLKNAPNTSKQLVMVSAFHWVIREPKTFYQNIRVVRKVIVAMRRLSQMDNVKVIWVGPPSQPDNQNFTVRYRNNFFGKAVHKWIHGQMTEAGIQVFDRWSMLYPRHEENGNCTTHYMCVIPARGRDNPADAIRGNLGQMVAQTLLNKLCHE